MMRFIFITNSPELARFATERGVDRVMVDLELLGKVARQGHLSTLISRHDFSDIARVRASIPGKELIVRLNPVHNGTQAEVDRAISLGADVLMLPMFRTVQEVELFCAFVGKRVRVCLLLETAAGAAALESIVSVEGVDEVHIGLNDLHLDLGHSFMFEPLANGMVDNIARIIHAAGLPMGIGGLARAGEGLLPAELLVAEHVRLHSTGAILSRTFHRNSLTVADVERDMDFTVEVDKLQQAYQSHSKASKEELLAVHREVSARIATIVRSKNGGA
jgi:hypothetical protein